MPIMNRPVGASSMEVTISANDRLGNGSFRSGLTSVIFMPGMLGSVPGSSPEPTGGVIGMAGGRRPTGGADGTSTGGRLAGGSNGSEPIGAPSGAFGSTVVPGGSPGRGGGDGSKSMPAPGSCILARVMSCNNGVIVSPYG